MPTDADTLKNIEKTMAQIASDLRGHRALSDERYKEAQNRFLQIEHISKRAEATANAAQRLANESVHEVKTMVDSIVTHNNGINERLSRQDEELRKQTGSLSRLEEAEIRRVEREKTLAETSDKMWKRLPIMISLAGVVAGAVAWMIAHVKL